MICMKWISNAEIRVYAETRDDGHILHEVMNPHGGKAILIRHCGLRVMDTPIKTEEGSD